MHLISRFALAVALAGSATTYAETMPLHDKPLLTHAPERYWEESLSGGPPKDGIPSIDAPDWWTAERADTFLSPHDRVIGVFRNGEARAYPQRILVWHEIVNDTIGGNGVSITYCPLTGTALGFLRGDNTLGVSGRLVNSNLIMYDRDTDSYWPQVLAAAVRGPHTGQALEEIRVVWTTWERWRERHPRTRVLSDETGFIRNYRRDPYGSYNPLEGYYVPDSGRFFPVMHENGRYPPKQEIFGFRTAREAVAVDRDHLRDQGLLIHQGPEQDYLIIHDPGLDTAWVFSPVPEQTPSHDELRFGPQGPEHPELEGLEPVNGFEAMWFAWYAFYPDTVVLSGVP
ncbi:MAG: DUF3179 domain-containing protein [Ectothiorhodospiraceae bacterium]|nr:DUF3179 domain-containing protein [Ectothiorhodospiraceae bacterium]